MPRYLLFVLFFLTSAVYATYPSSDVQGATTPAQSAASKKSATVTTDKSIKNTPTAAKAPAVAKKQAPQQPAAKKSVPAPKTSVAATPAKTQQAVPKVARQPQVDKPPQPPTMTKRTSPAPKQTKKLRKKVIPPIVAQPVETNTVVADTLPDINKQISSRSFMVMDAENGETILAKSPDNPRQPASTIKIVTAMIALKSLKNDDIIDVSSRAAGMPSSKIFLDPGRNYRANDLINAVLLASANDASVALAEKIAGSEDKFANLMTLSARMWGARNTICRTASGLTAVGQQSTARDLANLFRFAMQHDEFARRMREKFISTSYGKTLRNHNKALWRLDGAVGGKTGYTVAARQTYVGQFTRDNQTIVVAIMGSESMWADLAKLVDYGFRKKRGEQVARMTRGDAPAGKTTRVN